jgi:hypothetical protein
VRNREQFRRLLNVPINPNSFGKQFSKLNDPMEAASFFRKPRRFHR